MATSMFGIVHCKLRAATRNDHASIDRMLLPVNLGRSEDYCKFLEIHLCALSTLHAQWRVRDDEDFARMLACLRLDLNILGIGVTAPPTVSRAPVSLPEGLGIAYVIRGSRLGAAVLRRSVGLTFPTAYLDLVPAITWPQFLEELESIVDDAPARQEAIHAAQSAFKVFAAEFERLQDVISAVPS